MNAFKNWLIRKLIKNTNLDALTIFSVFRKMSIGEVDSVKKEIFEKNS